MQAEVGDPAVLRVPVTGLAGAAQERVEGVDRGLPERQPVALRADDEGQLQLHGAGGDRRGVNDRGPDLLLVRPR